MKYKITNCDTEGKELDSFIVEGYNLKECTEKAKENAQKLGWDFKNIKTSNIEA